MSSQPGPMPRQQRQMGGAGGQGGAPWADQSQYTSFNSFVYEEDLPATLTAGSVANLSFNIAGDSDFFWTKLAVFATVGDAGTTYANNQLPAVTLLVTNTSTGRQYSNNPVPLPNIAGTGQFPFVLPCITLWGAKSTIQLAYLNFGNQAYTTLQLSFIGIKAFLAPTP